MVRKGILIVTFVGLAVLGVLGRSFLSSRIRSNLGMVTLSKALAASPDAATLEAEVKALGPAGRRDTARLRTFHLAVRPAHPNPDTLDQAERYLNSALRWDADNGGAHRGLGWVWDAQGDLERAAAEWAEGGFTEVDFMRCEAVALMIGWRTETERWQARTRALTD